MIVNPKPVQKPLPPFWMATSSLDGVEVGARLGVNIFYRSIPACPSRFQFADAYWAGFKKHGHDRKSRSLGLLVPMHIAKTTGEAKARAEGGVMSYFKTILDLRLDYTDWLNRRGVELPARLRTAAGAMVDYDTVCEKHAVIGDAQFAVEKLKSLCERTGATQLLCLVQHRHHAQHRRQGRYAALCRRGHAEFLSSRLRMTKRFHHEGHEDSDRFVPTFMLFVVKRNP